MTPQDSSPQAGSVWPPLIPEDPSPSSGHSEPGGCRGLSSLGPMGSREGGLLKSLFLVPSTGRHTVGFQKVLEVRGGAWGGAGTPAPWGWPRVRLSTSREPAHQGSPDPSWGAPGDPPPSHELAPPSTPHTFSTHIRPTHPSLATLPVPSRVTQAPDGPLLSWPVSQLLSCGSEVKGSSCDEGPSRSLLFWERRVGTQPSLLPGRGRAHGCAVPGRPASGPGPPGGTSLLFAQRRRLLTHLVNPTPWGPRPAAPGPGLHAGLCVSSSV